MPDAQTVSAGDLAANTNLSRAEQRRLRRREIDRERGYTVSRPQIVGAYLIEAVVIVASLFGAWLFARQYGDNNFETMAMMMLAPVGYAVIEACRVPLAYATRTQTSWLIKSLAAVGVICAAGVTIKSMSQLGEIMFRPRLHDIAIARQQLKDKLAAQELQNKKIADADSTLAKAQSDYQNAESRVTKASGDVASLPPNKCSVLWRTGRDGRRFQVNSCSSDPRISSMNANLRDAESHLKDASVRLESAKKERSSLDRTRSDVEASDAQVTFDRAVSRSQLHSFTGMAFGIDPQTVSDGQVAQFLRIFVFAPAIFVSFAATMLAVTSVNKIKTRREEALELPDNIGQMILEPYARTIIEEAKQAILVKQANDLRRAVAANTEDPVHPAGAAQPEGVEPRGLQPEPPANKDGEQTSKSRNASAQIDDDSSGVVTPLRRG